jgi:hypothetical protein
VDARVVDVLRLCNLILVTLSSLQPFLCNGLNKARHFSDNVGAEAPGIHEERPPMCLTTCPHRIVPRHRSALSYPCDRPVGAWRGRARPVWLSLGSAGRTTHDGMSCLRHRSLAAGMPAPPRPQQHSCRPTRPRGPRGCRPSATPQTAPRRCALGCRAGASLGSEATSLRSPQHPATVASVLAGGYALATMEAQRAGAHQQSPAVRTPACTRHAGPCPYIDTTGCL